MKKILILTALLPGCAGTQSIEESDVAPYKALVVFRWDDDPAAREPAPSEGAPAATQIAPAIDRRAVEDELLFGLEDYRVFSDFIAAEPEAIDEVARQEQADLILVVRISSLAHWDPKKTKVVPGLAILEASLWFLTAVGGFFVPDKEFSTTSKIEMAWRRPAGGSGGVAEAAIEERESLSTGKYRLSMWDRAKPWDHPGAYLTSFVIPPAFVPYQEKETFDRSLVELAVEDLKREMARKLKGGSLGSGGAPFRFRLEAPANGATVDGSRVRFRFYYDLEPGFADYRAGFDKLSIEIKRGEDGEYVKVREYSDTEMDAVGERIGRKQPIEEEIEGLGPGFNLVRFNALTKAGSQWITNTVALQRR